MKEYYTYKHLVDMFSNCPNIESITIHREGRCYITQINSVNIPSFDNNTEDEWKAFYIEASIKEEDCERARNVSAGFWLPETIIPVDKFTTLTRADLN